MNEHSIITPFNLSPQGLLDAYSIGFFPMANTENDEIDWHSPELRAIIPLKEFKLSRSTRQIIKKDIFEIRINTVFPRVMKHCSERDETWITSNLIDAYTELHLLGYAHSVESWQNNNLVGGLYGVAVGGAFFGESMFHIEDNASKVAMAALHERLNVKGFELLDSQFINDNVARYGATEIPRNQYLKLLRSAIQQKRSFI